MTCFLSACEASRDVLEDEFFYLPVRHHVTSLWMCFLSACETSCDVLVDVFSICCEASHHVLGDVFSICSETGRPAPVLTSHANQAEEVDGLVG